MHRSIFNKYIHALFFGLIMTGCSYLILAIFGFNTMGVASLGGVSAVMALENYGKDRARLFNWLSTTFFIALLSVWAFTQQ